MILALALAACAPTVAPPAGAGEAGGGGAIRTLGSWTASPFLTAQRRVIRDPAEFEQVWERLDEGPAPAVEFERGEVVVLAASGQRPSGGHRIEVTLAERDAGMLMIEVVETTPGPGCLATAALTQPVTLVAVSGAAASKWQFVERRERSEC